MNVESENLNNYDFFYEVMGYPHPLFGGKNLFSWKEKNPYLDSYLDFIHQWEKIYKNLPFVEKIYLCNSLTFNSLNSDSDIDLFIVVQEQKIWTARFFCLLLFSWFHIKRSLTSKHKKFCLSFFVTSEHQNLDGIALDFGDPYLEHWVKHLTLLYQDPFVKSQASFLSFYQKDISFPIFLGNMVFSQRGIFKKCFEFILSGIFGKIVEKIFKLPQMLLIFWKKKKNPHLNRDVIISDVMLKFYCDKRQEYKEKIEKWLKVQKKK